MSNPATHTISDEICGKKIFAPIRITKSKLKSCNIALVGHYIDGNDYSLTLTFRLYLPLFCDEFEYLVDLYIEENNHQEIDIEKGIPEDKLEEMHEYTRNHLLEYAQEKLAEEIGIPIKAQSASQIENTSQSTYCDIKTSFYMLPDMDHNDGLDHLMFYRMNVKTSFHTISVNKAYALRRGAEYLRSNAKNKSREEVMAEFGETLVYYFPWNMHWAAEYGYEVCAQECGEEVEFTYYFYGDNFVGSTFKTEGLEDLMAYARELRPIKCE